MERTARQAAEQAAFDALMDAGTLHRVLGSDLTRELFGHILTIARFLNDERTALQADAPLYPEDVATWVNFADYAPEPESDTDYEEDCA